MNSDNVTVKDNVTVNVYEEKDFESLLHDLGKYGRYQMFLCVILVGVSCITSMHIIGGTIMAASVPYSCTDVIVTAPVSEFVIQNIVWL